MYACEACEEFIVRRLYKQAQNLRRCALKATKLQHGKLKTLHTWLISPCGQLNAEKQCRKTYIERSKVSFWWLAHSTYAHHPLEKMPHCVLSNHDDGNVNDDFNYDGGDDDGDDEWPRQIFYLILCLPPDVNDRVDPDGGPVEHVGNRVHRWVHVAFVKYLIWRNIFEKYFQTVS